MLVSITPLPVTITVEFFAKLVDWARHSSQSPARPQYGHRALSRA
jgi:hypothetical protein